MSTRAGAAFAARLAALTLLAPAAAGAQGLRDSTWVAQPQRYLLTIDALDARALWVQPAGLARRREASFDGLATVDGSGGLSQYGLSLSSAGFGAGWQHDRKIGTGTDVFSVGLGLGGPLASIGADHRWFRGSGAHDGSWDIGGRLALLPFLDLSLAWRDIGTPTFFVDAADSAHTIRTTLVPAAAVNVFGRAHLAAEWEIVTGGWGTSAVRVGAATRLPAGLSLLLRGEYAFHPDRPGLAVALTWSGPQARVTGFGTSARDDVAHYGLWASAVRDLSQPGRGPFR